MRKPLLLEVESIDVGGTMAVVVRLGDFEIGRYAAHTRYDDTAVHCAERAIVMAISPLIDASMAANDMELYEGDFYSNWDRPQ